jgi:transcriptional regulator with XRE-family HTH domain
MNTHGREPAAAVQARVGCSISVFAVFLPDDVASKAGLTRQTIARLEQDASSAQERTLRDVRRVFEDMGIEFLFAEGRGVGLWKRDV